MNVRQIFVEMSDILGASLHTLYHKIFMWIAGTSLALNLGNVADNAMPDFLPDFISLPIKYALHFDYIAFFSGLAVILLCIERALVLALRVRRIWKGDYSVTKPGE
jgi:hypothetical protein